MPWRLGLRWKPHATLTRMTCASEHAPLWGNDACFAMSVCAIWRQWELVRMHCMAWQPNVVDSGAWDIADMLGGEIQIRIR